MIKKAILILTLPTLVFIYLESCNKPCQHKETLNIVGIETYSFVIDTSNRNGINLTLKYESYLVNNFQFNLTNKAMALTPAIQNCFNTLLNPIDSISITSRQNFSNNYPANSELNSQFMVNNSPNYRAKNFKYDIVAEDYYEDYSPNLYENNFILTNDTLPTLDSIHNLSITVFCENGDIFIDSVIGINLKSKL